jgi:hypothetical protein
VGEITDPTLADPLLKWLGSPGPSVGSAAEA